jgi:hypothetical protein
MNEISRRKVMRSASALLALPFAKGLLAPTAFGQTRSQNASPAGSFKLSGRAGTAVSLDFVSFVRDYSAKAIGASYQGRISDYTSLGDQFHMLGKHLSLAGADKAVRAQCRQLLKTGTVPPVDRKAIEDAVASIQTYAPGYSAKELMSVSALPASPQEWAVHLKKLKRHGLVAYCHRAARQLKAMGRASGSQLGDRDTSVSGVIVKTAAYDPLDPRQAAHLEYICSTSQKLKFIACIGATVAAGLLVLAAVVAICGATALAACFGGAVAANVFFAGFGVISAALLTACSAFLATAYHPRRSQPPMPLITS